ncbi:MAG: hypothetical protein ACQES9_12145, partial [Myxococcota bacterium]
DRFERDYEYIISSLKRTPGKERKTRPKPKYKQASASISRSSEEVILETFAEAQKRDPEHKKEWIVLVDGDPHQIKRVKKAAKKFGVKINIIMDLIHVIEYLWEAARAFSCKSRKNQEKWVFERIEKILQGKAGEVAGGIGRSATMRGFCKKRRKPIDKCIRYLKKHLKYLRYNIALSRGYPICTGVIEGACQYLVKDRMEKTGCRWSIEGAETILKIRALRANNDFEEYWNYLCDKEKKELYCSKYKDGKIPETSKPKGKPVLTVIKGGKQPVP